jgi:ketosteroid isomerase-like protein
MSDPTELVRSMIEAFNADDAEALRRCLHPDVTIRRPLPDVGAISHLTNAGSYQGLDEVIPMLGELIEKTDGIQVEIRTVEKVGSDAVLFEFLALIGQGGERAAQLGWSLFHVRDDLVISTETFPTESAARDTIARGR